MYAYMLHWVMAMVLEKVAGVCMCVCMCVSVCLCVCVFVFVAG